MFGLFLAPSASVQPDGIPQCVARIVRQAGLGLVARFAWDGETAGELNIAAS
jgi:hypothetical protein